MWKRFREFLVCPMCSGGLDLVAFKESHVNVAPEHRELARKKGISDVAFDCAVDAGVFLCHNCKAKFPILNGLPALLTYRTPTHSAFEAKFGERPAGVPADYTYPDRTPVLGEEAVKQSFSEEWSPYAYDGVIWELSYDDHEARLLTEIGPIQNKERLRTFLEIGCGLGLTTLHAQRNFNVDAVGVDLSTAPSKATLVRSR